METSKNLKAIAVVVTAILASLTVGRALVSATPEGGELLTACVKQNNGQMRLVDGVGHCRDSEYPVTWNQMGAPGPPGPAGLSQAYTTGNGDTTFEEGDPPLDFMSLDLPAGSYVSTLVLGAALELFQDPAGIGPGPAGVVCDTFAEANDGSRVEFFFADFFLFFGDNEGVAGSTGQLVANNGFDLHEDTRLVFVCEHTVGERLDILSATWTAIAVESLDHQP